VKRISILLFIIAVSVTACVPRHTPVPLGADAPADNIPDIIGSYALNATDPTGEQYGGTLIISAGDKPNEYKLQWLVSGGIQEGMGVLEGNKMTANWYSVAGTDQDISGTITYTVTVNGELYGTRIIDGVEGLSQEAAYPNPR